MGFAGNRRRLKATAPLLARVGLQVQPVLPPQVRRLVQVLVVARSRQWGRLARAWGLRWLWAMALQPSVLWLALF